MGCGKMRQKKEAAGKKNAAGKDTAKHEKNTAENGMLLPRPQAYSVDRTFRPACSSCSTVRGHRQCGAASQQRL